MRGTDNNGRPIGYIFDAECDEPGCTAKIDRGLSYACGGVHGSDELSCDKYFCSDHLNVIEHDGRYVCVCNGCSEMLDRSAEDLLAFDVRKGISTAMVLAGMTEEHLSRKMNVSTKEIELILSGEIDISIRTLAKICDEIGVQVEVFFEV